MWKSSATLVMMSAAVIAVAAATASASNGLRLSPTQTTAEIREMNFNGALGTGVCYWTLSFSLHEMLTKVEGVLAGSAMLSIGECSTWRMGILVGGRRVIGPQGPYHVTYTGFLGSLPDVTAIILKIQDLSLWIEEPVFGTRCLTTGPQSLDLTTTGGNPATGVEVSSVLEFEGGFGCGIAMGSLEGSGSLEPSLQIDLV